MEIPLKPLLTLVLALLPLAAIGDTASADDLAQLRERISALQSAIDGDVEARDEAAAELRRTEEQISELSAQARTLSEQEAAAQSQLDDIQADQTRLADEKSRQLDWLIKTARGGYMAGAQARLKLLLNQEQPSEVARLLRYQDYFQQARQSRIAAIRADIQELLEVARRVDQAQAQLRQRQDAVARQQTRLEQARLERGEALSRIQARIADQSSQLARLEEDEARLEKLLRDMRQTLDDIPARPSGEPFSALRNKLPWPAQRRIAARFGSRREGPIRWNGVLLNVPPGTEVRAIHPGRVVYADWLRGYGLLTIVDHGDGFLTLYGHNESLLRQVGEWVSLGDTLALVGDSGGRDESGLYFEIRRNGQPINPDQWCNSRVTLPPVAQN